MRSSLVALLALALALALVAAPAAAGRKISKRLSLHGHGMHHLWRQLEAQPGAKSPPDLFLTQKTDKFNPLDTRTFQQR